MQNLRTIISILLPLSLFLFGCTPANTIIKITEKDSYPKPLTEPLPLNIGTLYKKEFREFETTVSPFITMESSDPKYNGKVGGRYGPWHIQLGQSSVALFDYILNNLFKEVRPIHHIPGDITKIENIDAIIEPIIQDYECEFIARGLELECYVQITYAIIFHLPDSKHTATWLIKGEGSAFDGLMDSLGSLVRKSTQISMRDVAAKSIVGFCKQEEIKQFLHNRCN